MSNYYIVSDELYHHGILGQKWGVRRFQNPDGSLTDAGRKRYSKQVMDLERGTFEKPEHYFKREEKVLRNNPVYKAAIESVKEPVNDEDRIKCKRAEELLTKVYEGTNTKKDDKEAVKLGRDYQKRTNEWNEITDKVIRENFGKYYDIPVGKFSSVGGKLQRQVMLDLERKYYGDNYWAMYELMDTYINEFYPDEVVKKG